MTSRHLVVFATSDAPDPYINSIAHSVLNLGALSIEIIVISEHDYPVELSGNEWATHISERVTAQLAALATNTHINYSTTKGPSVREPLVVPDKGGVYRTVLAVVNRGGLGAKVVPLGNLYAALHDWITSSKHCIFDVTALKKNLLIDVAVALLALGYDEVFTFELKRKPSFDQTDLYHQLSSPVDYAYRNLLSSAPVAASVSRLRRLTVGSRTVGLVASVLLAASLALYAWNPASKTLAVTGIVSAVASIVSALYPFLRRGRD